MGTKQQPTQELVLQSALRFLEASTKSRKELGRKLKLKGFSEAAICGVLDRLEDQGLLNDQNYAQSLYEKFRYSKPSGKRKISFEMMKRGIPKVIIEDILGDYEVEEEMEAARELFQSSWRKFSKLERVQRKKKSYDVLIRRGFDFQVASQVMAQETQVEEE